MIHIRRRSSFEAAPWKNGGGVTHEAMRVPPTGEAFSWRVSVAHIETSGPFSDFAGYERRMLLLQGRGLELKFGGDGRGRRLLQVGDWVEFDGAVSTHCDLIDGPCVDLNLMTSKSLRTAARLQHLRGGHAVAAAPGETVLIFSLAAVLTLEDDAGGIARLEPWDLAVLSQGGTRLEPVGPAPQRAPAAVFIATISQ
jgi:uncharacterized protein